MLGGVYVPSIYRQSRWKLPQAIRVLHRCVYVMSVERYLTLFLFVEPFILAFRDSVKHTHTNITQL